MNRGKDGQRPHKEKSLRPVHVGLILGGAVLFASVATGPAAADSYSAQPREAVANTERVPEEFAPVGIRLGAFNLLPEMNLKEAYSDNVFRTQNNTKGDFITTVSPQVQLQSDWARHQLNFLASADVFKYADNTSENREDLNLAGDFRVDVMKDINFYGGAAYRQLHEERGSPNDANGLKPAKYNLQSTNLGYFQAFDRFSVRLDGRADQYTYADVPTSSGIVREVDRNRLDTQESIRFGYDTLTGWEPFARVSYFKSDYRTSRDRGGFDKDSNGYEVVGGTAFNLNGIWAGEAFVGYLQREFDDSRFKSVEDPTFGLALVANVTPLTSVNAIVNRTISDTTVAGSSAATNTFYGLSADTEMRRNFVVGVGANFLHSDFQGTSRQDDVTTVGTRAKYFFSRYFSVGPEINYVTRDAQNSGGPDDYDNWIFLIRLTGRI
jgi:hypothetical protein